MSSAPTPPPPPEKPIKSAKWLMSLMLGLVGLFVLIDLASSIHFGSQPAKRPASARTPAGANVARDFDLDTKGQLEQLRKQKENLQQLVNKFGAVDWSHVSPQVPICNQDTRDKLDGKYFVTATSDGTPVRLACEQNDQWAIIPSAAASIEPLTPQQQVAMQRQPYGQASGVNPAEQRKQEALKRRQEALNSSSVALDFVSQKLTSSASASTNAALTVNPQATALPMPQPQPLPDDKPKYPWDQYTGQLYRVFEGTVIETVLTNRLNGEFTGPVNVMVATNVYSHNHQHILIPQGTRILGEAARVNVSNQRRLAVTFHRLIMPDGWSTDMDKFAGLDQQGASGLTGRVNTHWAKVIGTAILVGAIGGLSEFGAFSGSAGPGVVMETGIGSQTGQQATQILDRALNQLPTVTVFEGTRVRIWAAQDFTLPAYENHLVSPSL